MTRTLRTGIAQMALETSLFSRDRITLFWTLLFPVMIIVILGYSFGVQGTGSHAYVNALMGGIIGTNVMAMALFNIGTSLSQYRERGLFQRIVVSRASLGATLTGLILHRYLLVVSQLAIMMIVAHFVFGYEMPAGRIVFTAMIMFGVVSFTALGFAFALIVKSASEALALSNMLYLPLAFLSGAYFSVDHLPGAALLHFLPSAALIDSLRLASAASPLVLVTSPAFLTLGIWTLVFVSIAAALRSRLGWSARA